MMNFYFFQYEMQTGTGTANLKNQDSILNVTSDVLHFIGDSSVPDTIDKTCLESAKVLEQVMLEIGYQLLHNCANQSQNWG
ncbi:hypothetical protein RDI58_006324 [Solanum bulbocastanum]|uniref:Uncharacterized protein n=1 Tax=Solanum bulbocastanum TaxID=147425 RepID=A0AAN8U954_SOLBU